MRACLLPSCDGTQILCYVYFILGGGFHSALQNNNLLLFEVIFNGNHAWVYGGSIFVGENHNEVSLTGVTISGSVSLYAGGIFLSRFCEHVILSKCQIVGNSADEGGGLMSYADSISIIECIVERNEAYEGFGGMLINDAFSLLINTSTVRSNVAAANGGGIQIGNCFDVKIESCIFIENSVWAGSGGAIGLSQCLLAEIRNTSLLKNSATVAGGAVLIDSLSSDVTFDNTSWMDNYSEEGGGAAYISESLDVIILSSEFSGNAVRSGSGSAIYVRRSEFSLYTNYFHDNTAAGGGTLFWEHDSNMEEPFGLLTGGNVFSDSNYASFGKYWATEPHHLKILNDEVIFSVTDYNSFSPEVGVLLKDYYDSTVVSDSTTLSTVEISDVENISCYNGPGFLSGGTAETFVNGSVIFDSLEALCAPNHSLTLTIAAILQTISNDITFRYDFRGCKRGEYYGDRICNPCREGTYSFTNSEDLDLSDMSESALCKPCPVEAVRCEKDLILLKSGYWRSDNDSTNILKCPWDTESCPQGYETGEDSCGIGYHGPLCAICDDNYHFVSSSMRCEMCDDAASFFNPFLLVLIVLMVVCAVCGTYLKRRITQREKATSIDHFLALSLLRAKIYSEEYYAADKEAQFQKTYLLKVRIFKSCIVYITFYQIVSEMPFILSDVDFPNIYDRIVSAVGIVNLEINQESVARCSSSSDYDFVTELVISTCYPIVLTLLLFVACHIHVHWIKCKNTANDDSVQNTISLRYKKVVLVLSFLILPSGTNDHVLFPYKITLLLSLCTVSVTIFQTFSCQNVGSYDSEEDEYMKADYSISCDSERYDFAYWWAVAMTFVYPLGILPL